MSFEYPLKLVDCSIVSVRYECCELPFSAVPHAYKIVVVSKGNAKAKICNREIVLSQNDIALAGPYESFDMVGCSADECVYNCICFTLNSLRFGKILCETKLEDIDIKSRVFQNHNLNTTVRNICVELSAEQTAFSEELVSLLSSQMLVYLSRKFDVPADDDIKQNQANLKMCNQVMRYIDSRIYSMKNLREIAAEMGYNYSYISTLFSKTCGMTLNTYFKTKRMNEAKQLLQNDEMSVSEIARVMNYSSVYAFSKAFKEHFGASPGHYSGRFPKNDD